MSDPRDTFGPLPAYHPPVIGLTGRRHVGKTRAADHLVDRYGFVRVHPFAGGKVATAAYFVHLGADPDEARRMVNGDLRDVPSPLLPGNVTPRLFMERFGRFMGVDMGADWTLGREIDLAWRRDPGRPLIVESVVYEAPAIRAVGGLIVRIVRPDHAGPAGECTDAAQAALDVDATIVNDGDLAKLRASIAAIAQQTLAGR
jgi:hypothetical protein